MCSYLRSGKRAPTLAFDTMSMHGTCLPRMLALPSSLNRQLEITTISVNWQPSKNPTNDCTSVTLVTCKIFCIYLQRQVLIHFRHFVL